MAGMSIDQNSILDAGASTLEQRIQRLDQFRLGTQPFDPLDHLSGSKEQQRRHSVNLVCLRRFKDSRPCSAWRTPRVPRKRSPALPGCRSISDQGSHHGAQTSSNTNFGFSRICRRKSASATCKTRPEPKKKQRTPGIARRRRPAPPGSNATGTALPQSPKYPPCPSKGADGDDLKRGCNTSIAFLLALGLSGRFQTLNHKQSLVIYSHSPEAGPTNRFTSGGHKRSNQTSSLPPGVRMISCRPCRIALTTFRATDSCRHSAQGQPRQVRFFLQHVVTELGGRGAGAD